MTWSRFDDAAPKSPKALGAGNEAWALWAAAVMYCNRHLTDGYVTLAALATDCLPVPISLAKARKLAGVLCDDAKVRPDGAGLFEPAGKDKWKVHDFEHWNPLKAEVESKRQAERDRKRGRVATQPQGGRIPPGLPDGNPPGSRPDSAPPSERNSGGSPDGNPDGFRPPAGAHARVPVPTRPVPAQPDQPPKPPEPVSGVVSGPIPCPPDLELTADQRAQLAMMPGVPDWFVEQVTGLVRAQYADGSEPRTLDRWRRTLVSAITNRWSDPKNRVRPQATASGQPPARPVVRVTRPAEALAATEGPTAWERLEAEREAAAASAPKSKAEILAEIEAEAAAHG